MDFIQLARDLGLPLAMSLMGLWGIITGRVITAKSHQAIVDTFAAEKAATRESHLHEIEVIKEAHTRELAARDREIAERDRRLEAANITEARLIEMALRSTLAGEKAADTAVTALSRGK